jgi:hypothetical protein
MTLSSAASDDTLPEVRLAVEGRMGGLPVVPRTRFDDPPIDGRPRRPPEVTRGRRPSGTAGAISWVGRIATYPNWHTGSFWAPSGARRNR